MAKTSCKSIGFGATLLAASILIHWLVVRAAGEAGGNLLLQQQVAPTRIATSVIKSALDSDKNFTHDKETSESTTKPSSLFDRLAKLSLNRRDRLKDLHETFKERIGGLARGARSAGSSNTDQVYRLNIDLPVVRAEGQQKATSSIGGLKLVDSPGAAASSGPNQLVSYDDQLQDDESKLRQRLFMVNQRRFASQPFEHLIGLNPDAGQTFMARVAQRRARSIELDGVGQVADHQLASAPVVAHEPPAQLVAISPSHHHLLIGPTGQEQHVPSAPQAPLSVPMEPAASTLNQQQQQQSLQENEELQNGLSWPSPTGEPTFGQYASSSASGQEDPNDLSERSEKPGISQVGQMMHAIGEQLTSIPNAARLDRFVDGQELVKSQQTSNDETSASSSPVSGGSGGGSDRHIQMPLPLPPGFHNSQRSQVDFDEQSGEGSHHHEEGISSHHYKKPHSNNNKKIERHYSEEESHDSYEMHEPKKVIIKKEEKHHHHHHHHHHHEAEKKKEHHEHKKVHVEKAQPLHLEIHIKGQGKGKGKMKNKGKGKGKGKGEDEIYVKLNQGGHHGHHGHHGGYHMSGGEDDGSYVSDERESTSGRPIEDKKSLIEEDSPTTGGDQADGDERTMSRAIVSSDGAKDHDNEDSGQEEADADESKSRRDTDMSSHDQINTSQVPKYFEIFGDELQGHEKKDSLEEPKQEAAAHSAKDCEPKEEVKKELEADLKEKEVKKDKKKKKKKKKEEKIEPEAKKEEKKEVKVEEQPKEEVKVEEQPKEEVKPKEEKKHKEEPKHKEEHKHKKEEAKKEEEPKKEKKDDHIQLHEHKHFELHEHINPVLHPELVEEHHGVEMGGHDEHHQDHQQHDQNIGAGLAFEQPQMMHHHEPEHHVPIREHWVAPVLYQKPPNKHNPHGSFVIEDHSLVEEHDIGRQQPGSSYHEEIINHPHGFGLTPSVAFNLMAAHSNQKVTHSEQKVGEKPSSQQEVDVAKRPNEPTGQTKQSKNDSKEQHRA